MVTALAVLEVVYLLTLSIWIVLEKRSPLATLAWIFSLAVLPGVGFVVYYLLGPRRIKRARSRRALAYERLRASMPDLKALETPDLRLDQRPRLRQLITLALNNGSAPLSAGNDVRVLRNGTETFPAIEQAILQAKRHVHVEYYIFEPDETGRRLRDLLVDRAKAGVKVRLLVDAVGSNELSSAFLEPLLRSGAEFAVFNPVTFAKLRPALNFRNHRKIVVVDGRVGFTGGLNVGDEYSGLGGASFRDTHVRIEGPAVRGLQLVFLEDWYFATKRPVLDEHCFSNEVAGDQLVQIVSSGPDQDWQNIQQLFFAAITSARERVRLTTPYFVPDEAVMTALLTTAMRGVDVELLVPRRSDLVVVKWAGRSFYDELLKAGVRIYEYLPAILHSKTIVVDGIFASIGTANMDQRSFRLNWEVNAVAYGSAMANELDAIFEQDLTVSREVTLESRGELRFHEKLAEASARVLSPLL